ncbi:MAG: YkgJ family cysteine cluster protein [Nanoarchaeota archaeon]
MDIPVFECHKCGNCCKSVYRSTEFHDGFFVTDSEADWLRKEAKEKGISLSLKAQVGIADKISKKYIVTLWKVNHDSCPFFKEGLCSAYEKRPLICRSFPVVSTGLHDGQPMVRSLVCPQEQSTVMPEKQPTKIAIETLTKRYANNFHSAFLMEDLQMDERGVVDDLIKGNVINSRTEKGAFKEISLYDFLEEIGAAGNERKAIIQKEIETLEITKEKIRKLVLVPVSPKELERSKNHEENNAEDSPDNTENITKDH